jgi:hypothetical protein
MALPRDQVLAVTHDMIMDSVKSGVFLSNEVTKRFYEKREIEDGGNKIVSPLYTVDDTGSTGEFYSPRDTLSLQEYDGLSASEHDWKYLVETIVIFNADVAKNAGKAGAVKLASAKYEQAKMAMNQRMIKGIISDGTVSTGALSANQFVGLDAIIASSGTYGNIAPADLAAWISYVDDNGGSLRSLTLAILDKALDQTVEQGIGGATMGIMDKSVFTKFKGLLTGQQRVIREDTVNGQGHKGQIIVYNGVDHLIENHMPANTLFYVDEKHAKLHVQRDNDMRLDVFDKLETADASARRLFLYGAFVASERRFHSRINDITV